MKKAILFLGLLLLLPGAQGQTNAPAATSAAGDDSKQRLQLIQDLPIVTSPCVFSGDRFPPVDFAAKDLVQRAFGTYRLTVRYFSADWKEVDRPAADGRYGAWVTIQFQDGSKDSRGTTLYRVGSDYSAAKDPYLVTLRFPKSFLFPPSLAESQTWNLNYFVNDLIQDRRDQSDYEASMLASMHDLANDPERFRGFELLRINNIWWQELAKLQGWLVPYQKIVTMPPGYESAPDKKWPLIIFLHGSGERGDDLSVLKGKGPAGYVDSGHPLPFIVVSPLCPRHDRWNPDLILNVVTGMEKTYRIDPARIYLTGLSMGGSGTIDTVAAYPGKFAAIASLSGREDPGIAFRIRHEPAWFFHGEDDEANPARNTVELVEALKAEKAPVKFTLIPGEGHGGWDKVYANPALYTWFLDQHL
jgi:predicted esterase